MKTKINRARFHREDPATGDVTGGAGGNTPPDSLLTPPAGSTPPDGGDPHAWLPEKFRVMNGDALDEAASARKLAQSYTALEAHKGALPAVPETVEGYQLTAPEGSDADGFAAFTADPLFKDFASKAHAAGLSNEQLQFVVGEYLGFAPALMAANAPNGPMALEDARAELAKVWTTEADMAKNLAGVVRAINAFGAEGDAPGSVDRLMAKYGTDPDFIAFSARIATELKEDTPAGGGGGPTSDVDVEALQKSEAYWKPEHPDHAKTKAKVDGYYAAKFPGKHR